MQKGQAPGEVLGSVIGCRFRSVKVSEGWRPTGEKDSAVAQGRNKDK